MSKFKIGDRVRIIATELTTKMYPEYIGRVGTLVTRVNNYPYEVDFKEEGFYSFSADEDEIERVKIANTKLSRALYPDYKEDGKYLIMTTEDNK